MSLVSLKKHTFKFSSLNDLGAQDSMIDAIVDCMSNAFSINLQTLEGDAQQFASNKQIDPLSNLANHVCLFFCLSYFSFLSMLIMYV